MAAENSFYVLDRSGGQRTVRFDEITDRNRALCTEEKYGPPLAHVEKSLAAVTQDVVRRFKNGMTTRDLDLLTARVCAEKATSHRDYSDLAARITVSDLQKATAASFAATVRRLDGARAPDGSSLSRLHGEFVAIVERAAAEIDGRLDYSRDFRFTCFGIQTMVRSYLLRESRADGGAGPTVERPQHAYMRVALALCVGQGDRRGHEAP
jgi:ribonucleoside-diphosphate reductase subunit M1